MAGYTYNSIGEVVDSTSQNGPLTDDDGHILLRLSKRGSHCDVTAGQRDVIGHVTTHLPMPR